MSLRSLETRDSDYTEVGDGRQLEMPQGRSLYVTTKSFQSNANDFSSSVVPLSLKVTSMVYPITTRLPGSRTSSLRSLEPLPLY